MHTRACEDLGDVSVLASTAASVTLRDGAGTDHSRQKLSVQPKNVSNATSKKSSRKPGTQRKTKVCAARLRTNTLKN